jgi:DNA-binding NtrC family response regulator
MQAAGASLKSLRLDHLSMHANPDMEIIGVSRQIEDVRAKIRRFSPWDDPVLITGETGTGKELVARQIHYGSPRARSDLHTLDCTCLPHDLAESLLFGYRRGIYTGAHADAIGRLQDADGATLFLDEIGDLPIDIQPKLLRVLDTGRYTRLGDTSPSQSDVRIIAATNKPLRHSQSFRPELYNRLSVLQIHVPPLRERPQDIEPLTQHYMTRLSERYGNGKRLSREAEELLQRYDFPGNVRELKNILAYAFVMSDETIGPEVIIEKIARPTPGGYRDGDSWPTDYRSATREFKERLIAETLRATGGHVTNAAKRLSVTRKLIYDTFRAAGCTGAEDFLQSRGAGY